MSLIFLSLTAFAGGLLSFLSPCILPLVPAYICHITRTEIEDKTRSLKNIWLFILGFSLVFMALGAGAGLLHLWVMENRLFLGKIAGLFLMALALSWASGKNLAFLQKEWKLRVKSANALLVGLAFGFGWTPCIGPILASILALAASRTNSIEAVWLLGIYSLGIGCGFLLAGLFLQTLISRKKSPRFQKVIHWGSISLVFLTGFAIYLGTLEKTAIWLLTLFPFLGLLG
ncbi:MAG: cytochrome c biogenesis CcdA family protein [Parvibaculales bacterium]